MSPLPLLLPSVPRITVIVWSTDFCSASLPRQPPKVLTLDVWGAPHIQISDLLCLFRSSQYTRCPLSHQEHCSLLLLLQWGAALTSFQSLLTYPPHPLLLRLPDVEVPSPQCYSCLWTFHNNNQNLIVLLIRKSPSMLNRLKRAGSCLFFIALSQGLKQTFLEWMILPCFISPRVLHLQESCFISSRRGCAPVNFKSLLGKVHLSQVLLNVSLVTNTWRIPLSFLT